MQFDVEGFPPLFIGAGVGESWAEAKGKLAEIHPVLLDNITKDTENQSVWVKDPLQFSHENLKFKYDFNTGNKDTEYRKSPDEWLEMFREINQEFSINKVKSYLLDENNKGKIIAPAIGSLINLKFTYGNKKTGDMTDDQFTKQCLEQFIEHQGLAGICDPKDYLTQEDVNGIEENKKYIYDDEEDDGYDDSEDEDGFIDLDEDMEFSEGDFIQIDESDKTYGCTVQDLIQTFGNFVSKSKRICGIDIRTISKAKLETLIDYLYKHVCEEDELGAMEIMFLQNCNILKRTGVYVKDIDGSEVEKRLRLSSAKYDFDERVQ